MGNNSQKNNFSTPVEIDGVNFTPRELDILACILSGRTAKKVAYSLSLSTRTVEGYIRNILLKIEGNSRENIIDFLEKSDKVPFLRQRYLALFPQTDSSPQEEPTLPHETPVPIAPIKTSASGPALSFIKNKQNLLMFSSFILIVLVVFWALSHQSNHKESSHQSELANLVHSDLSVPTSSTLLELPKLMAQLDEKFHGKNGIPIVAIIGPGGSGKSTLAHQYALRQKASIIWEINAESYESIIASFEKLAKALTKNKEDQKTIEEIQDIKNVLERENRIFDFVSNHLRNKANWLLVYDNVENFSDLQKQFPQDIDTWGQGKVIITSRDANIQNNKYIIDFVQIGTLTPEQKFTLYTKIIRQKNDSLSSPPQNKSTKDFLEKIPPYPLDVTIAAYYIKATNTPYTTYIENLTQNNADFANLQKNLLKEAGDYTKTRYGIITVSLQNLLKTNKDFSDLLLLISLLDSQNIPRVLLDKYKNSVIVDNFIYHLKKYSLITDGESTEFPHFYISLHRSTQQQSFVFLAKMLELEKNKKVIEPIAQALEEYASHIIENGDLLTMKLFVSHCKAFLGHNDFLTDTVRGTVEGKLGGIYFHLSDFDKAKQFLDISLVHLRSQDNKENQPRIAWVLARLGNVYEKQGNYEQAKNLFEQSLRIYREHFGDNHVDVPYILTYLGGVYRSLGDYAKATELLEQSLAIYQKHFPDHHAGRARIFVYLGSIYRKQGDYEKSKHFLEKSLAIYQKHFPENHADATWASTSLASTYRNLGEYEKARALFEKTLTSYKEHFSDNHIRIATTSGYLGLTYNSLGNYEAAKKFLEKSLNIYQTNYPNNHLDVAWTVANLGIVYKNLGDYKKAKSLLEQGLDIYQKHYSKVNVRTAWVLLYLGEVFKELGDFNKAKQLIDQAVRVHVNELGDENIRTSWALVYLGDIHNELGNTKQATQLLEKSLKTHKQQYKDNHPQVVWISERLGNVYKALGHYEKARGIFELCLAQNEKNYGKDHLENAKILLKLGEIHLLEGQLAVAETALLKSLEIFQKRKHPESYKTLEALWKLETKKSALFEEKGDLKAAQNAKNAGHEYLSQALAIAKTTFPPNSPHIERIQSHTKFVKNQ